MIEELLFVALSCSHHYGHLHAPEKKHRYPSLHNCIESDLQTFLKSNQTKARVPNTS